MAMRRGLFKQMARKMVVIERTPDEEIEYQSFHRTAAMQCVDEVKKP
jgi:hypothetical protein